MGVKFSSDEWLEIVEDYKQSGLSLTKYADQLGIPAKTLANHTKSNNPKPRGKGRDVKKRSLSEWSKLIDEQITSGINRSAWCRERGISSSAMQNAERRIQTTKFQTPTGFAHVELKNEPATAPMPLDMGKILIRFAEVEIEADASYPTSNLARVIMEISRS